MRKLGLLIRWWSVRWWLVGMVTIVLAVGFNVLTLAEGLQILIMYTLVLVTAQYAKSAAEQVEASKNLVDETKRSQSQAVRASLDIVILEHNWKLFEYKVDPGLPELPSLAGNKDYWKWRMVHLDHLNLLHTRWTYYTSVALVGPEEIKALIGWAQLLLGVLQNDRKEAIRKLKEKEPAAEPETREIMVFEETSPRLKALLHISELHNWDLLPHKFVSWLLDECEFSSLGLSKKG